MLTIAISKGRLQEETLELFSRAGIEADPDDLNSRRLQIKST
jgi:ATP phosphoribosyltransferase